MTPQYFSNNRAKKVFSISKEIEKKTRTDAVKYRSKHTRQGYTTVVTHWNNTLNVTRRYILLFPALDAFYKTCSHPFDFTQDRVSVEDDKWPFSSVTIL